MLSDSKLWKQVRNQRDDLCRVCRVASSLWCAQTAAGSLQPTDDAYAAEINKDAEQRRKMFSACGRVFGLALYQELHRRLGARHRPDIHGAHNQRDSM